MSHPEPGFQTSRLDEAAPPPLFPAWSVVACAACVALSCAFLARRPGVQNLDGWPGYAQSHSDASHALLRLGHVDQALAHAGKAVEFGPQHAAAHNNLGNALLAAGKSDEARAQYERALQLNPSFVDAHYNLGNLRTQQGRHAEALAEFETTIRLQPAHAEAHYNLGFLHLSAGRLDQAREHYTHATTLNPGHAPSHSSLGLALLQMGQTRQAVQHFETALQHDPRLLSALNNLAWVLATAPAAEIRDAPKALELAARADQITSGGNPGVLKTLAAAYAATGQFEPALRTADRAMELARKQQSTALLTALEECIRLFRSGQPCLDPAIR